MNPLLEAPQVAEGALEPARTPLGLAAFGLASLVAERGLGRLGMCAADDCTAVFADTSAARRAPLLLAHLLDAPERARHRANV